MGLAGEDNQRNLQAIALLALFLSFSSFSVVSLVTKPVACFPGDIGTLKCPLTSGHDSTSLGTWIGMPSAETELMGNTSYRGLVIALKSSGSIGGLLVGLMVTCINPSNTVGASLQLQYANYSDTTHSNSSNFVNIGISQVIDNSANNPCPGNLEASQGILPDTNTSPSIFLLRVVGSGGGGQGDNPRFASVAVYVVQRVEIIAQVYPIAISTTGFKGVVAVNYKLFGSSTTYNFQWIASTNGVLTESGTGSCTITTVLSCTSATITFATSFAGTPNVVCTPTTLPSLVTIPIETISLLTAQTVTV